MAHRILIVEDEEGIRFGVRDFFAARGYEVEEAATCAAGVEAFRSGHPDVTLLDYSLPDGDALQLLPRLKEADPEAAVVVLTGHGTIDLAVRAIKMGAEQFLTKPIELKALLVVVERLIDSQRNRKKQIAAGTRARVDPLAGDSPAIRALGVEARRVLPSDQPILILGETGTGKGMLAAWLHANGPRCQEPFVDLNCAGLSKELLESELFGHERGAFTGAVAAKPGLLDAAHKGTLFLDELGDMDLDVQPKLLKVVEERRFRRLGDVRERRVDVRLIAATQQDLGALVREGRFRPDLYYRMSALPLSVPPLRRRREDILPLARRFLQQAASGIRRGDLAFRADAEAALLQYSWPGNIRELRNVVERGALLATGGEITAAELRFEAPAAAAPSLDLSLSLEEMQKVHIQRVLEAEAGNVEAAARRLGLSRSALYARIRKG